MNSKYIFTVLAVIVVLGIGLFIYTQGQDDQENTDQGLRVDNQQGLNPNQNINTDSNTGSNHSEDTNSDNANLPVSEVAAPATGEPTVPENVDVAVFEITYNGSSFTPSSLPIKSGDVVIFKNESSKSFWPVSGITSDQPEYPEFDAKKAILPGQNWQFKFTNSGEWSFHDNLNPSAIGKIKVQ